MKRNIIVITTVIGKKDFFVQTESPLANGEVHVVLIEDICEAKEYQSAAEAKQKLRLIRNPFDRPYSVASIQVTHEKKKPALVSDDMR